MQTMSWVQECQKMEQCQNPDKIEEWSIYDSVSQVRKTFKESRHKGQRLGWNVGLRKAFQECRAVRVNGPFSELNNIPKEFGLVLYGGPKLSDELNGQERSLTINGFLFPERQDTGQEFVKFDWLNPTVCYGVPNPIMAQYYADQLVKWKNGKRKLMEEKKKPKSAADLLARVLPYMTFTTVVSNPILREGNMYSSLSKNGLPYEDDYNEAIAAILSNDLKYMVATPRDEELGKTDIVVTYGDESTCSIETIMASRDKASFVLTISLNLRSIFIHNFSQPPFSFLRNSKISCLEHAERFLNPRKLNYFKSQQKALLIIGGDVATVKGRVAFVAEKMKGKLAPRRLLVYAFHEITTATKCFCKMVLNLFSLCAIGLPRL